MTNRQDCDIIKLMEAVQASFDYPKWENPMGEVLTVLDIPDGGVSCSPGTLQRDS